MSCSNCKEKFGRAFKEWKDLPDSLHTSPFPGTRYDVVMIGKPKDPRIPYCKTFYPELKERQCPLT